MTIGERIEIVIEKKVKPSTKSQLAKDIGITPSSVTTMCNGKSNPSGQTISMICKQYGIREEWLRTGAGPMEEPKPRAAQIADLVKEASKESPEEARDFFLKLFADMTDAEILMMYAIYKNHYGK